MHVHIGPTRTIEMSLSGIQKVVLRSLIRQSWSLQRNKTNLWLQTFPRIDEFQSTNYCTEKEDIDRFVSTFPEDTRKFLLKNIPSRMIDGKSLRRIVVDAFRQNPLKQSDETNNQLLDCMKLVFDQVQLTKSTSITVTDHIRVVVTTVYDSREDDVQLRGLDGTHSYYYRVAIENSGEEAVRLVGRHWIFKSKNMETEVPKFAPGVLGLNPRIHPGKTFQYMSMAHLEGCGSMEGAFLLEDTKSKEPFEVKVGLTALTPDVFTET